MKKLFATFLVIVSLAQNALHASSFPEEAMIFSGNANHELAEKIADYLGVALGDAEIGRFNDGEIQITINTSVRNKDVFVVQSNCTTKEQSVNDNLMELFLMVRALKRSSAANITAVIPYYGYARQDRKTSGRAPISAADVAMMLESAGVDRVVTVDLHCGQIQGFFRDIPVDNLYASSLFTSYFAGKDLQNVVVVSPDAGGVERAKRFVDDLRFHGIHAEMALISKQRAKAGVIASMSLIGNVEDADAIIIDDMCDTGGTLVKAAALIKEMGARRVFATVTHPVFSNTALELIRDSVLDEMVVADTIPLRGDAPANLHRVSVSSLLAEAIRRTYYGESISALFNMAEPRHQM